MKPLKIKISAFGPYKNCIDIDFEKLAADNAQHFLQFMRELSFECKANGIVLSTDIYVPAAFNMFYNRGEQGVWADYVVIMGYDEHYSGSDAGSVASLNWVKEGVENTLKEVPSNQVILGMPFYTRLWELTPPAAEENAEVTDTEATYDIISTVYAMKNQAKTTKL